MNLLLPLEITQAILTSNGAGADTAAEYLDATTYALDAEVKVTATASPTPVNEGNAVYKSLQASNQGNDPTTDIEQIWWEEQSGTVKHEMFDPFESTQTTATTSLEWDIVPTEIITGISFHNLDGYQIEVICTSALDGEVYNEVINLVDEGLLIDEWAWCFEPIVRTQDYAITNIPPYDDLTIEMTLLNDTGETAACGICAIGYNVLLGGTQWGAAYGLLDYSLKVRDTVTGRVNLAPAAYAETGSFRIKASTQAVSSIRRQLTGLRGTPLSMIPTTVYDGTSIWGFIREWRVVYETTDFSILQIDAEGLS